MCVTLPSTINTVIGGLCLPEELVFSLRLRLLILKLNLDLGLIAAEVGGGGVAAEMGVDAAVVALEAAGVDVADNGDVNVGAVDSFVAAEEEAAAAGAGRGGANGGDRVALIAFNGSTTDTFDLDANICAWVGITGDSIDDCLLLSSFDDVERFSMLLRMLEGDAMFKGGEAAAAALTASCSSCSVASFTGDEVVLPAMP